MSHIHLDLSHDNVRKSSHIHWLWVQIYRCDLGFFVYTRIYLTKSTRPTPLLTTVSLQNNRHNSRQQWSHHERWHDQAGSTVRLGSCRSSVGSRDGCIDCRSIRSCLCINGCESLQSRISENHVFNLEYICDSERSTNLETACVDFGTCTCDVG